MAETVGDIAVRVGANIDDLRKGMTDGARSVKGFSSSIAGDLRAAASEHAKYGAAAVAAAAAATAAVVAATAAQVRELRILSAVANTSVGDMQRLSYASKSFGIEQDKLADILKDFNDRVGDFNSTGGGPMADFFENIAPKVGVTAKQFQNLSGRDALQLYISSLEKANLSQADMTFYMEAMASDSTRLLPLFKNNAAALGVMTARVDDLGLALTDIEVEKIEAANVAFDEMKMLVSGAAQKFTSELSPVIVALGKMLGDTAVEAGGVGVAASKSFGYLVEASAFVVDAIDGIKRSFEIVSDGMIIAFSVVAASIAEKISAVLKLVDKIPGIDYSEAIASLESFSSDSSMIIAEAFSNIQSTLNEPMASDNFKQFVADAGTAGEAAAQAAVAAREAVLGTSSTGGGQDKQSEDAAKALAKKNEMELEAVKNRFMTEEQLLAEHRELMGIIGSEYDATKFESEEQWRSITEQAEAEHLARMTELNRQAYDGIAGIIEQKWGKGAATTANAFKSILNTAATGSRKAFEISKAWALGDALVSTYQGIAAGVKLGYPAAIPAVAAASAVGFAQVSAIKNQSFGGGGGAAASGGGAPATAPNPVNVGGDTGQAGGSTGSGQSVALQIDPDAIITGRGIISMLEQAVNNGANISFLGAN